MITLHQGNCLDILKTLADSSVDSCVTDPPYGLSDHNPKEVHACLSAWLAGEPYQPKGKGFMGKSWDAWVPGPEVWREVMRVLKPGGHLLAFAGTRSMDLMSMAVRLAGFELRDAIGYAHDGGGAPLLSWVYGEGFPKSMDISSKIDQAAGAVRPDKITGGHMGISISGGDARNDRAQDIHTEVKSEINKGDKMRGTPVTEDAKKWAGWGTALKPSYEPVILAQKPYGESDFIEVAISALVTLEKKLWSMLSVSAAEQYFKLSQKEYEEASASVQWNAAEKSNTRAVLCEVMGMSQFELATASSLNTVLSWKSILADTLKHMSTSTTETKLKATTNWKTLRFCSLQITPDTIILAHKNGQWQRANACIAARNLNAMLATLNATLELFALESATSQWLESCPEKEGKRLSPDWTPIFLARKPFRTTVTDNVLAHGTGGLNIKACRIETTEPRPALSHESSAFGLKGTGGAVTFGSMSVRGSISVGETMEGRWPANLVHDGSEVVLSGFPDSKGQQGDVRGTEPSDVTSGIYGKFAGRVASPARNDAGSAARFFYCSKASQFDRSDGLNGLAARKQDESRKEGNPGGDNPRNRGAHARVNHHPTVKPTDLMRYLCRLVTPPGGTVLDPFMGSGSTGKGAELEGFSFIGIELDPDYVEIARNRISSDAPLFKDAA